MKEKDRFLGSMLGGAIGDAIGELAFLYKKKDQLCKEVEKCQLLVYTDDTAMAIGIAKAIVERSDLEEMHLGKVLDNEFCKEPWRGYAPGPPTVFALVRSRKLTYSEAAASLYGGSGSYGNGAAMRVAPVALFFHALPKKDFYEKVKLSAMITHTHPIGIDGAVIQARAISLALTKTEISYEEFIDDLIQFCQTKEMKGKLKLLKELLSKKEEPKNAINKLGKSVAAHESVPFSLFCFLRHPYSFKDCLMCAVLNGGDRDTLGAMACSICGAYLGIDAIPQKWKKKIENLDLIKELTEKLYEMHTCYSRI